MTIKLLAFLAIALLASFADAGPFGLFRLRILNRHSGVCGKQELGAPAEKLIPTYRQLDPQTFAGAIKAQLEMKENLTLRERRILHIINSPDSAKRDRQLYRMELAVRGALDLHANEAVNWSEIDWPRVIGVILEILVRLLPLLL